MKTKNIDREKQIALYKHLKENESYSMKEAYDEKENDDYLVLTDDEADEQAKEYIKESLWAFNTSFILGECGLDLSGEDSLKHMQEKSCEGANDFILSLVEKTCGLESFVDSAISADGRGHFLSPYDGEENEINVNGTMYFIYRIN